MSTISVSDKTVALVEELCDWIGETRPGVVARSVEHTHRIYRRWIARKERRRYQRIMREFGEPTKRTRVA